VDVPLLAPAALPVVAAQPREGSPTTAALAADAPSVSASSAGGRVSNGDFGRWLALHPEWQRDAAIAAGRADDQYLSGWVDLEPPNAGAAVHVSWSAANAFCSDRGGLARLDAAPVTWRGAPSYEWRTNAGRAASLEGETGSSFPSGSANFDTGFRCMR
jgi:hypothetical protein